MCLVSFSCYIVRGRQNIHAACHALPFESWHFFWIFKLAETSFLDTLGSLVYRKIIARFSSRLEKKLWAFKVEVKSKISRNCWCDFLKLRLQVKYYSIWVVRKIVIFSQNVLNRRFRAYTPPNNQKIRLNMHTLYMTTFKFFFVRGVSRVWYLKFSIFALKTENHRFFSENHIDR